MADTQHPALYAHFDRERWRGVDLLIGCGDLPGEYLDFLATSLGVPFLYVRGNHDTRQRGGPQGVGENIDGRLVMYKGLRILGFEGSAWYGGRGIEYTQRAMAWRVWSTFPRLLVAGRPDIVVTHAPPALRPGEVTGVEMPAMVLDVGAKHAAHEDPAPGPDDPAHKGFAAFTSLIALFAPQLWLHGHAHLTYSRARRVHKYRDTLIANAYEYLLLDIA